MISRWMFLVGNWIYIMDELRFGFRARYWFENDKYTVQCFLNLLKNPCLFDQSENNLPLTPKWERLMLTVRMPCRLRKEFNTEPWKYQCLRERQGGLQKKKLRSELISSFTISCPLREKESEWLRGKNKHLQKPLVSFRICLKRKVLTCISLAVLEARLLLYREEIVNALQGKWELRWVLFHLFK